MQLGIIEVPTLKDLFVEKIEARILSGKLKPGDCLPSERQLQMETHISKSVIHAGLEELAQKGFVEIIPRKGTVVANFEETGTVDYLNALIRHSGGNMNPKQTKAFLETRIAIEGSAMRRLAENVSAEDIEILSEKLTIVEELAASENVNTDALAFALFNFYRSICMRSGNEFFPLLLNELKPIILLFWDNSIRFFGASANLDLCRHYLEDIRSGNGDAAYNRLVKSITEYISNCSQ